MTPEQKRQIRELLDRTGEGFDELVAMLDEREAQGLETPEEIEREIGEIGEHLVDVIDDTIVVVRRSIARRASRDSAPHHPVIQIDVREQIREQRGFHQSTAGPPEPDGINEIGPAGSSPQAGPVPSCSTCNPVRKSTANLTRIADFSQPDFSGSGEVRSNPGRKHGAAGLEIDEVRHDNSKKPH